MIISRKSHLDDGCQVERWYVPQETVAAMATSFPTAEKILRVQICGGSALPRFDRVLAGYSNAGHPWQLVPHGENVERWTETWVVIDEGFGPLRVLHCVEAERRNETSEHLDEYLAPRQLLDNVKAAKWNAYLDVRATMLVDLIAVTTVYSSPRFCGGDNDHVESKVEASRWRIFSEGAATDAVSRLDTLTRLSHPALKSGAKLIDGSTRGAVASIAGVRTKVAASENPLGCLIVRLAYIAKHPSGECRFVAQLRSLKGAASVSMETTLENAYRSVQCDMIDREKLVAAIWMLDQRTRTDDALVAAEPGVTLAGYYCQLAQRRLFGDMHWSGLLNPNAPTYRPSNRTTDAPF
jgi:hypothetical protein